MHYTSIENIHKVIDPLFLEDLQEEFNAIKQIQVKRTKDKKLDEFQNKLATLTFLDKTTPRLIQFHTLKNAVNPPFLGGFLFSGTVAA